MGKPDCFWPRFTYISAGVYACFMVIFKMQTNQINETKNATAPHGMHFRFNVVKNYHDVIIRNWNVSNLESILWFCCIEPFGKHLLLTNFDHLVH